MTSSKLDVDLIIEELLSLKGSPGKQANLPEISIRQLCSTSREIFLSQPTLVELASPVNICGDIHGQFDDLLRHLDKCGYPPEANYLFLGDYVDRGKRSLETICLVLAYKVKYPDNIFLLRGNHECASINRIYGFYDECKRRYNIKLWKAFTDCFNTLPIAATVENTIFCIHGGLSPELKDVKQLLSIERPLDVPDHGLVCDLLWSDPDEDITGWGENDRGVSFTFGGDVVKEFLKTQNFSLIVRAHQVVEDGYQFFQRRNVSVKLFRVCNPAYTFNAAKRPWKGRYINCVAMQKYGESWRKILMLVTVFSAPNYCGEFDNAGAVLVVTEELMCSFKILPPSEKRNSVSVTKALKK